VFLLAISVATMAVLFVAVLYFREQSVLNATAREMRSAPQEQLSAALNAVRSAGLSMNVVAGMAVIFLKACLLAALTLLVSTFATTNIFTVVVMVFVYFIGHLQATAREYWLEQQSAGWIAKGFLAIVALIFPDLQAFNVVDDVVAAVAIPAAMLSKIAGLGFFYIAIYTLATIFVFYGKEL
jgi:ABC-2 type transport system permease protein